MDVGRRDRRTATRGSVDDAVDDRLGDERPRRVVYEHDVGIPGDDGKTRGHRVLTSRAAGHDRQQLASGGRLGKDARLFEVRLGHDGDDAADARSGGTCRDAALEDRAVAQRQPLLGDDAAEAAPLAAGGDDDIDDHEARSMRVVRYTAMRSAVRPILAMVVVAVLLGAALFTLRALGTVDPRGRTSWLAAAPAFDATPRDVVIFLPACDVSAVVLHPATPAAGLVEAEFFVAESDGSARRTGAAMATAHPGTPIALPLGEIRPPWRAPLVVRLRHHGGILTLDARQPFTLDLSPATRLGSLACAFDGGSPARTGLFLIAVLVVLLVSGVVGVWWLARALGAPDAGTGPRGAAVMALLAAGATVVTYLLVVPPFEPPDELAHFQYARFVATTGTLPSAVPPHDSEWRASSYEFVQQPLYYIAAAAVLKAAGLDAPGPALTLNPRSRLRPGGTEPTIFHHGAPPSPSKGHRGLLLLRLCSVLMALATTWVIARLVTTVSADPLVVVTVAGGLGLIPQWCAVMGAVSTDPPATLLAATATLAIVRVALGRRGTRWLLLTGVVIGAAYAVKATAVFLAPMAIAACLAPKRIGSGTPTGGRLGEASLPTTSQLGEASLPTALRSLSLVGLGMALAAGWIHLRAWMVFGDPQAIAFKTAILEAGGFVPAAGPMPWSAEFWSQMRVMVFEPFWARFGSLGAGPFPGSRVWLIYVGATALLVLVAAIGVIAWTRAGLREVRAGAGVSAGPVAVAVCTLGVSVGLVAWLAVNLVPRPDMVVHWTPRHILPLTAPAALLVGAGLERLRQFPAFMQRTAAAATGLTVVALAIAWLAVLRATMLMLHFGY